MLIEMVGSVTAQSAHAILAKFHEETHDLSSRIELRALVNSVQSEIPSHLSCDAIFKFFFPFLFNYPKRTISQRRNLKFNFFAYLYESFETFVFIFNGKLSNYSPFRYANEGKVTKKLGVRKIIIR